MPSPYTFPVWLLTVDDIRNNQMADMMEDTFDTFYQQKKTFYDSLDGTLYHNKVLYDLLTIQHLACQMLTEIFRCNLNILNSTLPEIDVIRMRNVSKRVLSVWNARLTDIIHPYSDGTLLDTLQKRDKWDGHPKFVENGEPADWNGVILSRLSDIHKHLYELAENAEPRILINRPSDMDIISKITESILPGAQAIYKELKDYTRFINSL